jgi:hypothetical protein
MGAGIEIKKYVSCSGEEIFWEPAIPVYFRLLWGLTGISGCDAG